MDPLHAVMERGLHHEAADHVVDAGAETAARDDADPHLGRLEEDLAAGAGRLEARQLGERHARGPHELRRVVEKHPVVLGDIMLRRLPGFDE